MTARTRFIKSAMTSTPVANSRAELERMLTRYGCTRFAVSHDYDASVSSVSFVVRDTPDDRSVQIPVRLEVKARLVYDAMFGRPVKSSWDPVAQRFRSQHDPNGYNPKLLAQAERVAWRQLLLWVDAALSAASAGLQPISEAFLAHTLVRGPDGVTRRVAEQMDAAAGGSWLALLPSGDEK